METTLARFDGYRLRALDEADYARLAEWIADDPSHNAILDPEFFMGQAVNAAGELGPDARVSVFALEDKDGPLMYIRLARASRVHIQFPPAPETKKLKALSRMTDALVKGMAFLEVGLARAGCAEWIFDTESDTLRLMVQKRMGFAPSPHEMVRVIPRLLNQEEA